jgi:hypothetical protein
MTIEYAAPEARPAVIPWFTAYCILMTLLYGVLVVVGVVLLIASATGQTQSREDAAVLLFQGILFIALGLPLAAVFGVAPFLARRPWVWVYDLVLICWSFTSLCCLPATIPLLIYWIKPETKAWFGRL